MNSIKMDPCIASEPRRITRPARSVTARVLAALQERYAKRESFVPNMSVLALDVGSTPYSVGASMRQLVHDGWLVRERAYADNRGAPFVYSWR